MVEIATRLIRSDPDRCRAVVQRSVQPIFAIHLGLLDQHSSSHKLQRQSHLHETYTQLLRLVYPIDIAAVIYRVTMEWE